MSCSVYVAHALTGRPAADVVRESRIAAFELWRHSIVALDPATAEGVQETDGIIRADLDTLQEYWRRDKDLIRKAHVLLDLSGPAKSEGVAHEIGYARYCLWKPVVRVWPGLKASIARLEDDIVVDTVEQATEAIYERWGTKRKRIIWRLRMLVRCLPQWIVNQAKEFK